MLRFEGRGRYLMPGLVATVRNENLSLTAPVQVGSSDQWVSISAGISYSMALKRDGTLWTWGYNVEGNLGHSEHTLVTVPQQISPETNWKSIAVSEWNSAALKVDGSLWCWGDNTWGQLGDGSWNNADSPRRVGSRTDWVQVSLNKSHHRFGRALALASDSSLWTWGNNFWGALGNGLIGNTNVPTTVSSTNRWAVAACKGIGTYALSSDGRLWSWPSSLYQQAGVSSKPELSNGATDWSDLGVGDFGVYGIRTDTTLWDISANMSLPGTGWIHCSSGIRLAAGLKKDGTLWQWGATDYFNDQDYSPISVLTTPTQLTQETNWMVLSIGGYHALALKRDGSLWAWGANFSGQLGEPAITKSPVPIRVGSSTDWKSIAAGVYHSLALKIDGTMWAWGENLFGQLGLPATWRPYQVGTNQTWRLPERSY